MSGSPGHADAQRRRAARPGQPDRLDVDHGDAELVLDRAADRLAPPPADVEVRGLAPAVRDREHLVRREEAERVERDGDGERHADEDVEGVVDAEVQSRATARPTATPQPTALAISRARPGRPSCR